MRANRGVFSSVRAAEHTAEAGGASGVAASLSFASVAAGSALPAISGLGCDAACDADLEADEAVSVARHIAEDHAAMAAAADAAAATVAANVAEAIASAADANAAAEAARKAAADAAAALAAASGAKAKTRGRLAAEYGLAPEGTPPPAPAAAAAAPPAGDGAAPRDDAIPPASEALDGGAAIPAALRGGHATAAVAVHAPAAAAVPASRDDSAGGTTPKRAGSAGKAPATDAALNAALEANSLLWQQLLKATSAKNAAQADTRARDALLGEVRGARDAFMREVAPLMPLVKVLGLERAEAALRAEALAHSDIEGALDDLVAHAAASAWRSLRWRRIA
jgi:hypothetical protein